MIVISIRDAAGGNGEKTPWNGITTRMAESGHAIVVQMVLDGQPDTWVEYNRTQLKALIARLEEWLPQLK